MRARLTLRSLPQFDLRATIVGALSGACLLLSAVAVGPVLAVHDLTFFQLDHDYQVDAGLGDIPPGIGRGAGEDWDVVYGAVQGTITSNAVGVSYGPDLPVAADDIFTSGSKDTQDISQWRWTFGKANDSSNLQNGATSLYIDTDPSHLTFGHRLAYFGTDRYGTNGTLAVGIWLFRNQVARESNGTFSGVHDPNDILVQLELHGGEFTATSMRIYRWSDIQVNRAAPQPISVAAECSADGPEANACMVANPFTMPTVWPYVGKNGSTTMYAIAAAFEGGIDLTGIGIEGCYAQAMITTRVSDSVNASTNDFIFEQFSGCATPTVATSLSGGGQSGATITVPPGTPVRDQATLAGVAPGTPAAGTVTYRVFADAACTQQLFSSGPLTLVGGVPPESDPLVATVPGHTYYWTAEYSGDDTQNNPAESECGAETQTTSLQAVTIATTLIGGGQAGPSIGIELGQSAQDVAAINGAYGVPTGTITFRVYSDAACEDLVLDGALQPVEGGGPVRSPIVTPTMAGTYNIRAFYSGDAHNAEGASACGDEVLSVAKLQPAITTSLIESVTQRSGEALTVTVPASVRDQALLSGVQPTAGGSVLYEVFASDSCSGAPIATSTRPVTNGEVGLSGAISITDAGTTYWQATYSGDANHEPAVSDCGSEVLLAEPATPAVQTTLHALELVGKALSFPPGSIVVVTDQAEIVGGSDPTGTVTYQVFDNATCEGPPIQEKTVIIGAGGVIPASDPVTLSSSGVWAWVVSYSGDDNNNPAESDCGEEIVAIGLATPTMTTSLSSAVDSGTDLDVAFGKSVTDQATLRGATDKAGGQVTYSVYLDRDCGTLFPDPNNPSVVTVSSGSVPESAAVTFDRAGTFYWRAAYSGDESNAPFATSCVEETVTVARNKTGVTTALVGAAPDGSLTVAIGDSIQDTATITDATDDADGELTYTVYIDSGCDVAFATGGTVDVVDGVAGSSDEVVMSQAGTFYAQAVYRGDENNAPSASDCTSEVVTVPKDQTSTTTSLSTASSSGPHLSVPYATTVTDQATIEGLGQRAAGIVTYTVYADDACTDVYADAGEAPVSENQVGPSQPITFFDAATYFWQASYSGDVNHEPSVSDCTSESVVVAPARLNVDKSVDTPQADPGDTLSYQIEVTNNEEALIAGITVVDDISDVIQWGAYQNDCNLSCSFQNLTLTWDDLVIPAGSTVTLTYSIVLGEEGFTVGTTTVRNTVAVAGAENDCPPGFLRGNCTTDTPVEVVATPTPPTPTPPTPTPTSTGGEGPIESGLTAPPTDTSVVGASGSSGGVAFVLAGLFVVGALALVVPRRRTARRR